MRCSRPGGNLPDVLFKAALTSEEMIRYSDSDSSSTLGRCWRRTPQPLGAAGGQSRLAGGHPLPNGKIAALPAIQQPAPQNAMWINQAWLDRLGLEAPTDWTACVRC